MRASERTKDLFLRKCGIAQPTARRSGNYSRRIRRGVCAGTGCQRERLVPSTASRELPFGQVREHAGLLDQLLVVAALEKPAALNDQDSVRIHDRAEPMSNDDSSGLQLFEASADDPLRVIIQSAGGLIEEQDPRPGHD